MNTRRREKSQSEASAGHKKCLFLKTEKRTKHEKETLFPISPAVAAGYPDCPVIGRFQSQQSKTRRKQILLMSCFSGQSQSIRFVFVIIVTATPCRCAVEGALPLVGSDLKRSQVTEHKDAPLVISHNTLL